MKRFFAPVFVLSLIAIIFFCGHVSQINAASVWTQQISSGQHSWYDITSSSDGTKLAAVDHNNGYIYTSINSGEIWTARTSVGTRQWMSITSSSDGTKLAAVADGGYIYTSIDDGATWTERSSAGQRAWFGITSSSDGTKLAAVVYNGYIHTSIDSGVTWTERISAGQRTWFGLTSSSDGSKLAAIVWGGFIYTSIDSGVTWTVQSALGPKSWRGIASSADGTKLSAVIYDFMGYVYTSDDSGLTWNVKASAGPKYWDGIASSSDGTKLVAVATNNSYVYISNDRGITWIAQTSIGQQWWSAVSSSADGTKLAVGSDGYDYIYTYRPLVLPTVSTGNSSSILVSIANLNGNILSTGGENPTVRGFQLGLTTDYGLTIISDGSFSPGSFSAYISDLTPNTTYHFRSYATNSVGTSYGEDVTFTTLPLSAPVVQTIGKLNVTFTTATLSGLISNDGGNSVTVRGFEYGLTNGYGQTTTENGLFGISSFSANISNLTPNSTYHFRSYATNSFGTTYGEDMIFSSVSSYWKQLTSAGQHNWYGITSSVDGNKLAAIDNNFGYIYTSTDNGVTWTAQTSSGQHQWHSITSSADGTKLAAVDGNNGYIYTSTDSGVTWTARTSSGQRGWYSITSSADGTKLAAGVYYGYIYTSTDSGVTWTERTNVGQRYWYGITSSTDGNKLAAVDYSGYIYTSSDYGSTWIKQSSSGQHYWYSISSSADGTKLAAVDQNYGYIYTSTDSGSTWTTQTGPGQRYWYGITSSADGNILAAASTGYIYTSVDGGVTWTTQTDAGSHYWYGITSSANGNKLAASDYNNGYLYTYGPQTTPIVSTSLYNSVGMSTAILVGNILNTGGNTPTVRGFEYGRDMSYGQITTENGTFSEGTFTSNITNLACETLYHFRSFSTNTVGTSYGENMTFTTSTCPTISSVTTIEASNITPTKVKLNGEITNDGGEVATRGFNYGLTTSYGADTEESAAYYNGVFESNITSLICNSIYHFRAYGTNFAGTSYGADMTFATSACSTIPEISSLIPDSKTSITVNISGSTNNFNIENITKDNNSGWTTNNSYQFKNLTCNTEYSFRVKGKGSDGIETVWSPTSTILLPCIITEAVNGSVLITTQQDFLNGELEASLNTTETIGDLTLMSKPSGAKYGSQWGGSGSQEGQFSHPSGIATDVDGNIYVSDRYNNRIQKFSADGTFLFALGYGVTDGTATLQLCTVNCQAGISGSADGQLSSPWGIDIDGENNIYIVDLGNSRIQKFNPDGTFNSKFGTGGNGDGQFTNPMGIAIDSLNNLYVADNSNSRIQKFNSNGEFITKWGGTAGNSSFGYTFDKNLSVPSPWSWSLESEIPTPLMAAGSAVMGDKIYLAGGTDDNGDPFDSFFVYDTITGEWTTKDPIPYPTTTPVSTVVDGKLYLVGGKNDNWEGIKTMEVYDSSSDTWTTKFNGTEEDLASMTKARIGATGGYDDGKIYVVGGAKEGCAYNSQVSMEVYNIATNTWTTKSSAPINKLTGSTSQFIDGIMYVAGGQFECDSEFSNSIISYNPATDTWNKELANMPGKRTGGSSVVVDGKFYYIGGTSSIDWNTQSDIFAYDPSTNAWESFGGSLPHPIHRSMVSLIGDDLYIIGGRDYNWDAISTNYKINKADFGVLSESPKTITSITWTENLPTEDSTLELFYSIDNGANWVTIGSTPGTYDIPEGILNSLHYKAVYTSSSQYSATIPSLSVSYTMDGISYEYLDDEVSGNYNNVYNLSINNELIDPVDVEIDSFGNVYVTDSINGRSGFVHKYNSDGTFITKWGYTNPEYLLTYFSPTGIAVDTTGDVHYLEERTKVAYKTSPDGTLQYHYGDDGSGDGEFYSPQGIAIDSSDNIYIADTGNNRIQKFEIAQSGRQPSGIFISSVINAGAVVDWTTFIQDETLTDGTSITYFTRSGQTSIPDNSWSDWQVTTGDILSPNNQYLQVKAILATTSTDSPILHSMTVNYIGVTTGDTGGETGVETGGDTSSSTVSHTIQTGSKPFPQYAIPTEIIKPVIPSYLFVNGMKLGSTGIDVQKLQEILIGKGYLVGLADGIFGKATLSAVMALQRANNLVVDGIVGKGTIAYLNSLTSSSSISPQQPSITSSNIAIVTTSSQLRFGSKLNDLSQVKLIQTILITKGYLIGTADGIFGQKTLSAVIDFQKKNNLLADGIVGTITKNLLMK